MFINLLFGALFGFILSRVDATSYAAISKMFQLQDLHLMGVIGGAIVVAGIGLTFLRRRKQYNIQGRSVTIKPKPRKAGNIAGSLLFGAGWAITGTCPGTALAQIGEGQLIALFTLGGILLGTELYRRIGKKVEAFLSRIFSSQGY